MRMTSENPPKSPMCLECGHALNGSKAMEGLCAKCFTSMQVSLNVQDPEEITKMVQRIFNCFVTDVSGAFEKDPAAKNIIEVLTAYPGIKAVLIYRVAHFLWEMGLPFVPRYLSSISKQLTGIDIHPAAKIGDHFFIDHGEGVVIGENAEIGDNVTIYQGVTLGGVNLENVKRHPTLKNNVIVGSGAKILGPVVIGNNVKIGANSVVVNDIPDNSVVVGIPGRVIKTDKQMVSDEIHNLSHNKLPDPIVEYLHSLEDRISDLESQIKPQKHE